MASLKEIFEKAQQTGKVEYTYFGGTNVSPFTQTTIPFSPGTDKKVNSKSPYIRLGYEGGFPGDEQFRTDDPTNTYNALLASTRDVARIGAFFTDTPRGPLWLTKQSGLQLSNPDTSYKTVPTDGESTSIISKLQQLDLNSPRFYNPVGANTLASVGGNALGLHFTRHGLSPVNDSGYISQNTDDGIEFKSRLTLYNDKLIEGSDTDLIQLNGYTGGPNSFYGIGRTRTFTYQDSFGINTGVTNKDSFFDPSTNLGFVPWAYSNISEYGGVNSKSKLLEQDESPDFNKYPRDFRVEQGKIDRKNPNPNTEDYRLLNVHNRIGVTTGQAGNTVGPANPVDSINVINIAPRSVFYGYSNSVMKKITDPDVNARNLIYSGLYDSKEVQDKTNGYFGRDIIKFRIEILNNDTPQFAGEINTDVLAFRAYLGDLTDDFNPTWKPFNYMGRGEEFYIYEKFTRKIQFSFFLLAHSKYEMPAIYTKLNYLMSSMAPDYNSKNQMRGNYAYLTIGDYIYQQPGVFTSMNISNLLDAPWEITLKEPNIRNNPNDFTDKFQHEIPKYMKVTMGFNPIHNFLPKRNKNRTPEGKLLEHTATFVTPNFRTQAPNYYLPQDTKYVKVRNADGKFISTGQIKQQSTLIDIAPEDIPVA